jgi:surface-adhesin protein E
MNGGVTSQRDSNETSSPDKTPNPESGPVYAEWMAVEKSDQGKMSVCVDPDTIHRNGDVVEFWVLMDFETTQTEPRPPHMSVKSQREIDCTKKRVRLLAMTAFSGNMGSGRLVHSYSDFNDQGIPIE